MHAITMRQRARQRRRDINFIFNKATPTRKYESLRTAAGSLAHTKPRRASAAAGAVARNGGKHITPALTVTASTRLAPLVLCRAPLRASSLLPGDVPPLLRPHTFELAREAPSIA